MWCANEKLWTMEICFHQCGMKIPKGYHLPTSFVLQHGFDFSTMIFYFIFSTLDL
jgi:hypothetical protein